MMFEMLHYLMSCVFCRQQSKGRIPLQRGL